MHLYAAVIRIYFRALLKDLQRPDRIFGDQMIFRIVAHRGVRIQLSSDRNSISGTLHRGFMSSWRTVFETLSDPRSAECKIVPGGSEAGGKFRHPLEHRFEISV